METEQSEENVGWKSNIGIAKMENLPHFFTPVEAARFQKIMKGTKKMCAWNEDRIVSVC